MIVWSGKTLPSVAAKPHRYECWWELTKDRSHSNLTLKMKGDNNTDLMERFGITSGIQQAPFEINANMNWMVRLGR